MCLAVPGKIISIKDNNENYKTAMFSIGGVVKEICIDLVPDVKQGDYAIVHAGYAINILDEEEAKKTIDMITEMLELEE